MVLDRDPGHVGDLDVVVRGQALDDIDLATLQRGALCGWLADDAIDHPGWTVLALRPAFPVIGHGFELVKDVRLPASDLEGSGTSGVLGEPRLAVVAVDFMGLNLGRVYNEPPGQEGQEGCIRRLKVEAHCMLVDHADAFRRQEVLQHPGHALVKLQPALKGIADRFGIYGVAIVELGRFGQLEGPALAVLAHFPAFGEPRLDFNGFAFVLH